MLYFTRDQSSCDVKMQWERNTQRRMVSATIDRRLQEAMEQYQMTIDERRERFERNNYALFKKNVHFIFLTISFSPRLRELLESEEQDLFNEIEARKETVLERQAKMRERAKTLREKRESEREKVVADKLEQLFR